MKCSECDKEIWPLDASYEDPGFSFMYSPGGKGNRVSLGLTRGENDILPVFCSLQCMMEYLKREASKLLNHHFSKRL